MQTNLPNSGFLKIDTFWILNSKMEFAIVIDLWSYAEFGTFQEKMAM